MLSESSEDFELGKELLKAANIDRPSRLVQNYSKEVMESPFRFQIMAGELIRWKKYTPFGVYCLNVDIDGNIIET